MPKIKTSELIGPALDWTVAKCMGQPLEYGLTDDERYSTEWGLGGPIIELNIVELVRCASSSGGRTEVFWEAVYGLEDDADHVRMTGPTPLIAAMRCFVFSKLGDEVEIPEELLT